RILHDFTGGKDGANPKAEPIIGPDGYLYGTTEGGGKYGNGVVYQLRP
ncbi:MAG: hypothetical protein JO060_02000, partial [Candidatus Eremiobacteraeota bacterium]|nr:hypothetical protein [Candidatus Eremiobacteraeota bacterium]